MSLNYVLFGLYDQPTLAGDFERLYRTFWDTYLEATGDTEMLAVIAPFFVFRGLVIASPQWYPGHPLPVRQGLLRFLENVLSEDRFDYRDCNRYMSKMASPSTNLKATLDVLGRRCSVSPLTWLLGMAASRPCSRRSRRARTRVFSTSMLAMGATNPEKADAGTIRKTYALDIEKNSVHGSDAPETAAFETAYFFSKLEMVG